jgi:hypothetical protein
MEHSSEAVTSVVPKAWWEEEMKTTPWWYDTPTLHQPLQHQAWYLPKVKAPELTYLKTSPKITLGPVIWVGLTLGAIGLVAHLLED